MPRSKFSFPAKIPWFLAMVGEITLGLGLFTGQMGTTIYGKTYPNKADLALTG
jgi:hypothetical protein